MWEITRVGPVHERKQARKNSAKKCSIHSDRGIDLSSEGMVTITRVICELLVICDT